MTAMSPVLRKICLLGARSAGKSSFLRRHVDHRFDEDHRTTLGVRIDRITVCPATGPIACMVHDGQGEGRQFSPVYARGMSGYLLFVDGTRRATLDIAEALMRQVTASRPELPFVLVLSKCDLGCRWEIGPSDLSVLGARAARIVRTSAKTGEGVSDAFESLATAMTSRPLERRG